MEVMKGVIDLKDKHTIIKLKETGHSNREVARLTGLDRKTVASCWNTYQEQLAELNLANEVRDLQEAMVTKSKYDICNRRPRKYNDQLDAFLDNILENEAEKSRLLGNHKQKLTAVQMHALAQAAGYDIGLTTITEHIRIKRDKNAEAFIKQEYDFAQRLEYDFGEVKLEIGGIVGKYYLAVLSSPAAGFRWAYLYTNQKKEAFMDSHVKFFEMAKGVYDEVVYDNMKNVVTKFIGKSEKQLNEDLIKMSIYYGFRINVTNVFSGNEKGHVESSVKTIRNKVFALNYRFDSLEEARARLTKELYILNEDTKFVEEQKYLLPYKPPLELAIISEQKVDKYSFVRVENNFYSVPDYLVGRKVLIKNYPLDIVVYSGGAKICGHVKKEGFHEASVEINHYLTTLQKKPGALRNSVALKSRESLKAVFDKYYTRREREFIALLMEHSEKSLSEVIEALMPGTAQKAPMLLSIEDNVMAQTKLQLHHLSMMFMNKGGAEYVN
jgi:transposase